MDPCYCPYISKISNLGPIEESGEEDQYYWYRTLIYYRDRTGALQAEQCYTTINKNQRLIYTSCFNTENPGKPYTPETRHAYKTEYGK